MNKGVELLLARRRTNPEEFTILGRWDTLLVSFQAYPLTRETKPCNPREFNRLVTSRLLTASDLAEPWKVALSQAQLKIAKKMGIAPETYAKMLARYERHQGEAMGVTYE